MHHLWTYRISDVLYYLRENMDDNVIICHYEYVIAAVLASVVVAVISAGILAVVTAAIAVHIAAVIEAVMGTVSVEQFS